MQFVRRARQLRARVRLPKFRVRRFNPLPNLRRVPQPRIPKVMATGFTGFQICDSFFGNESQPVTIQDTKSNGLKVVRRLGEGGCATVFEVEDQNGERFALKAIPMDQDEYEIRVREIQAMRAADKSENVVRLHDAWLETMNPELEATFVPVDAPVYQYETSEYMLFMKTELFESSLTEWLRKKSRRESQLWSVFRQVTNGLQELHKMNYMHRDIKPDNIFVRMDEQERVEVKIGDLGLAKRQESRECRSSMTMFQNVSCFTENLFHSSPATSAVGTYAYMAPEQRRSQYNNKVDIYALGMILWELNETEKDRDERHFTLMRLRKTGSAALCNLKTKKAGPFISWMMRHDPSSRPTARQILQKLDQMS